MVSPRFCFTAKITSGAVDPEKGRVLLGWLDEAEANFKAAGDTARDAMRKAAIETADEAAAEAARKAQIAFGTAKAQADVMRRVTSYTKTVGELKADNKAPLFLKLPLAASIRSMLVRDPFEIGMSFDNVVAAGHRIRAEAHSLFAGAIEAMRPKMLGFKAETAFEGDVLRELWGSATGNASARAVAEAWTKTAEHLRIAFNKAGGAIPFRQDWRIANPAHDAMKVRTAGRDQWKAFVKKTLDRDKMVSFSTGRPLTPGKLDKLLDQVFDSIVNEGIDGGPRAAVRGRPALANTRADARVLLFKDAEAWMTYANAFGEHQSVYQAMMDHIDGMAADIAKLEVLGPNPVALKRYIDSLFDREAGRLASEGAMADAKGFVTTVKGNKGIKNTVKWGRGQIDNLWSQVVTGDANRPVHEGVANAMSDMRSWLVSSQLGSAIISSITDPALLVMTARFNDLPAMKVLGRAIADMARPGAEIDALQHGFIADSIAGDVRAGDRFMGEAIRTGIASKASSAVIRASGLRRWTATLRNAFGMEFQAKLANDAGRAWSDLSPAFRDTLQRYGIAAEDWKLVGEAAPFEPRPGAKFIRHMDVAAIGSEQARRVAASIARMVDTEMTFAVIESDALTRAVLLGKSQPGTLGGETRRAFALYKSFIATFVTSHMFRAFARGWDGRRLGHAAGSFALMSTMGLLALQAKQIANGRDPLPTADVKTIGAAILQGGGLGIFGDFLFADQTRYGNSWATTIVGPQAGAVETVLGDWLIKNTQLWAKGEETHFAGDGLYVMARYMPGSTLWQTRLAFQRAIVDQLALQIDPRAPERFQRIEKQAAKEAGQRFWWAPGSPAPRRLPSLIGDAR